MQLEKIISKNPLFYIFVFPAVVDMLLTVIGQDEAYWQSFKNVNEASPAYIILVVSPFLFLGLSVLWLGFWFWFVKNFNNFLGLFVSLLFLVAHSWGSSTWIRKWIYQNFDSSVSLTRLDITIGWLGIIAYFALCAAISTYALLVYAKNTNRNQ